MAIWVGPHQPKHRFKGFDATNPGTCQAEGELLGLRLEISNNAAEAGCAITLAIVVTQTLVELIGMLVYIRLIR
jgi:hypothetical protein